MAKVITFGEIMLRLNPEGYLRFTQSPKFRQRNLVDCSPWVTQSQTPE